MSKHLCHWSAKDTRRVGSALYDAEVHIHHIIWLDALMEDGRPSFDPLEDFLEEAELEDLLRIFGADHAESISEAIKGGFAFDTLLHIGGWLVIGNYRPLSEEDVYFDDNGKFSSASYAFFSRTCTSWSPYLHRAIGKCISIAQREKRDIIRKAKEAWLQEQEAGR